MGNPVQLPAGYADAKPFQSSPVQLPAGYEDAQAHQLTPQGASPDFWSRVKGAIKPKKYSEEAGFAAKVPGQPEALPGVSEGAGLAGGLAEWDKASGGEIAGGVGDILRGDVAKGLHRMFTGTGHAMTPVMALTLPGTIGLSALPRTALTLGGAAAGGALASTGAEALGASPEQAQVASDVGNVVGGIGANRVASLAKTGIDKARALWDLIPEETQKSLAKKALSMVPGAKTVSTGLDIKKDISSILDALRTASPVTPAPTAAAAGPAVGATTAAAAPAKAAPGEMTSQGWYYLGRLQEIAKGIEEQEAATAAPKNITPARAAKLTKPVTPAASTDDLTGVLNEMLNRVNVAKGTTTAASAAAPPAASGSTLPEIVMQRLRQQEGLFMPIEQLQRETGASREELDRILTELHNAGKATRTESFSAGKTYINAATRKKAAQ